MNKETSFPAESFTNINTENKTNFSNFYDSSFEDSNQFWANQAETLINWEGIEKKLDKFSLESKKGEIHKKRVIGILGENGIGKTTFVKILAGEIKITKGFIPRFFI